MQLLKAGGRKSTRQTQVPDDVETLRCLVLEQRRQSAQLTGQLEQARAGLIEKALEIEKLKAQLAKLRRMTFGRSSEKLDQQIEQLELMLGDLEETLGQSEQRVPDRPVDEARDKAMRRPLPDHLPREEVVHAACSCPSCGGELRRLGEDVTEILEYRPRRFRASSRERPRRKLRLSGCPLCGRLGAQGAWRPIPGQRTDIRRGSAALADGSVPKPSPAPMAIIP